MRSYMFSANDDEKSIFTLKLSDNIRFKILTRC